MDNIRSCIFNGRPAPSTHDNLELARIGTCQPHGVLIIANSQSGVVGHVSANCTSLLGVTPEAILQNRATAAFQDASAHAVIEDILQPGRLYFDNPQRVTANGTEFEVICHVRNDQLFIELEPYVPADNDYPTMVSHALETMSQQTTKSGLYNCAVDLMQYVTGWDRAKLYKFVSHGHGTVVAEKKRADSQLQHSFLNFYFSAGDTPQNALDILKSGKTRQKPTQDPSVPMLTKGLDGNIVPTGEAADLTDCWLRGIHPCDNGYNRNIGVASNIIFPVMVDADLWGLFVIHSYEQKFLNYDCRTVIEQMTMIFVTKLIEIEEAEAGIKQRYRKGGDLLKAIEDADNFIVSAHGDTTNGARQLLANSMRRGTLSLTYSCPSASAVEHSDTSENDKFAGHLLSLVGADGAAVLRPKLNGHLHLIGDTPDSLEVRGIASLFGAGLPAFGSGEWRVFATDALGDYTSLPEPLLAKACGLLAAPIGDNGDLIMWFRAEQVSTVTWAGAPWTKKDLSSERMFRSRDDFKPTQAPLRGASRKWLDSEVAIGARFAETLGRNWERSIAALNAASERSAGNSLVDGYSGSMNSQVMFR